MEALQASHDIEELQAVFLSADKLNKDLRAAIKSGKFLVGLDQARFLVDYYYQLQKLRCGSENQLRSMEGEPTDLIDWLHRQLFFLEQQIKSALEGWTDRSAVSRWAKTIVGIGPILSAGLEAHIDISRAATVGRIWSYAGLNPKQRWIGKEGAAKLIKELEVTKKNYKEPGTIAKVSERSGRSVESLVRFTAENTFKDFSAWLAKRPWNGRLKTLCWKVGQSFIKVSGNPKSWYGARYKEKKAELILANERGEFKEVAEQELKAKRYGKSTEAYKAYAEGRLPDARITARAARYAAKLFLSHWHEIAYMERFKKEPPAPYIIEHGGHSDWIRASEVS